MNFFKDLVLLWLLNAVESNPAVKSGDGCGQGVNSREGKILSGEDALPHEFPWMVSIKSSSGGKHFCGGFVVNQRHIISAAHCFLKKYNSNLQQYSSDGIALPQSVAISLGQHNITQGSGFNITIESISVHPDFEMGGHLNNDIAVLRTSQDMNWGPKLSPICLPGLEHHKSFGVGHSVTVAGWGNTNCHNSKMRPSKTLKKVSIPVWKDSDCLQAYQEAQYEFKRNDYVCAGADEKDSSKGDSGSALMIEQNNRWTAIGIVSAGRFMCEDTVPGLYTKISSFNSWISSQID